MSFKICGVISETYSLIGFIFKIRNNEKDKINTNEIILIFLSLDNDFIF